MNNTNSAFLKEMGISEWVSRDGGHEQPQAEIAQVSESSPRSHWWFFGSKPQGEAEILFQNILRVLALNTQEWSWKNPADKVSELSAPDNGLPLVAIAFGGPAAQKITGERDPLPQLRETVLALNNGADDEIPVIATLDLNQLVSQPKDKALLWQDLLLAKSVLQNI
ncbi:DNA polymerase III subunit psi [Polynucleobacter sp. MWH-Creno-3A4]|uniref:DNA polymerase III subunit psi n=1 Tax=Polynucleobacter sp. MWH-Creno-3A4 TaxID=1855886 RepID=UPI001C0AB049|nr:DNA polymerase III subunit psi [Polynucleobacter sp. MWH-Creno-3A4]MBU3606768.1 DNA polymerase III subunit psi [Polynucleobacter sp. MWH-Creno-3A4]